MLIHIHLKERNEFLLYVFYVSARVEAVISGLDNQVDNDRVSGFQRIGSHC